MECKPKFDNSYLETKLYIIDVRCIIADLKSYDIDLVGEVAAKALISYLVFSKLPSYFRQELVRKLDENSPSINQVFDHYGDVVKTLNMRHIKNEGYSSGAMA